MARKPRKPSKSSVKAAADRAEKRAKGEEVEAVPTVLEPPETAKAGRDEKTGRFLPGNKAWEARSSHGANPKFEKADDLWKACCEYFTWVEANPLWEDKLVTFQGSASHEPVAKMRAMTIAGLCLFLDISRETWGAWWKTRPDLSDVLSRAETVIYQQKFSGAAADLLNANIIARELGLADKSEITGKDGGAIAFADTGEIDQARRVAFALGRALERQKVAKSENAAG